VKDSVLLNGVRVGKNAHVEYSILDENVTVSEGAMLGSSREKRELTVIGREGSV
jgi:ADP-glucose pyrophosphorylase